MDADEVAELRRRAFLSLNREDEEGCRAVLDEEVVWVSAAEGLVPRSVLHGLDEVREGRRQAAADGRHVHTTLQEIRVEEDRALVIGVVTSEGPHRGRLRLPMAWIWRVRDGRVVHVESFTTRPSALSAWERG